MAPIPSPADPTLEAADAALVAKASRQAPRPYLGMSGLGRSCERQIWSDFRWAAPRVETAEGIRRIEDGFRGEDVQADRLRAVEGVILMTVDPETGRQWRFEDVAGHVAGHMDGAIVGLIQAPKTWHVWEHKQVAEAKQSKLEKLKAELGEKNALAQWDPVYFAQAQIYMHHAGLERHYMTVASPGGRRTVSVRTDYDAAFALRLVAKARRIVEAPRPPGRVSEKPEWFECRWCQHAGHCHGTDLPNRNCRTCLFATPVTDGAGGWRCGKFDRALTEAEQRAGCRDHRFIPDMVPGIQEDAADDASWIAYELRDGRVFVDEGPADSVAYAVMSPTAEAQS
jgi:hypothetical protein